MQGVVSPLKLASEFAGSFHFQPKSIFGLFIIMTSLYCVILNSLVPQAVFNLNQNEKSLNFRAKNIGQRSHYFPKSKLTKTKKNLNLFHT